MSDTLKTIHAPERGLIGRTLGGAWDAWSRFWFTPANPTTLGLMRICAGLIIFYIHLAYTPDLVEIFGKDGWSSLRFLNRQRAQSPWISPPTDWNGSSYSLYLPDERVAREELFAFLRKVPDDERQRRLMIDDIKHPNDAKHFQVPAYIATLPDGPPEEMQPLPLDDDWRRATKWQVIRFIKGMPATEAERTQILEYQEYWGFDPRGILRQGSTFWSVWFHVTDPFWMMATHVAILGVMLLFTVGFCTRITSVLAWLGAVSYVHRSGISVFGGDTMLNILLIYLMIAPAGAALSVDRLIAYWWRVRKARLAGLAIPRWTPPVPSISANFAQRMLMIHFCIIYFASGSSKLLGGYWWNGVAVYYTMANYEFAPLHRESYLAMMRWLAEHRTIWEFVMAGGTFGTLALELSFPFLVWNRRLRPFMVGWSMILHINIALFMGLVAFSLLMATMVMSFIPGDSLAPLVERIRRRIMPDPSAGGEKPTLSESAEHPLTEDAGEPEPALAGVGESAAISDKPSKKRGKGDK
jgi:hypothetical protein